MSYPSSRLGLPALTALGALAALAAVLGAGQARSQDAGAATPDPCAEACAEEGLCERRGSRCVAGSSTDCQNAGVCSSEGRCTERGGTCVLGSSSDCARTAGCEFGGQCTLVGASCEIGSDADCQRSSYCHEEGACTFQDGSCVLASSEDCRRTNRCVHEGRCSFEDGACVARGPDCAAARVCRDDGRCTARDGECVVAAPSDCRTLCRALGRCAPDEHRDVLECAATTDAMCRRSEACTRFGHCTAREGRCVATSDATCRRARTCREDGACTRLEERGIGYCGPADAEACARATRCSGGSCTRSQRLDLTGRGAFGGTIGWMCSFPTADRASILAALAGATPPPLPGLFASRNPPPSPFAGALGTDAESAVGAMMGATVGESFGMGGLGLRGTGRGGGGTGEGTIGLGTLGTIGRGGGGGGGIGSGYGRGAGGFGRVAADRAVTLGPVETEGPLPTEIVRRILRRRAGEIEACAAASRGSEERTVTLRLRVDRIGRATRPALDGRVPGALRTCLLRRARQWAFPATGGTTRVSVRLSVHRSSP